MRESHKLGEIRFTTLARAGEGLTQWRPLLLGFLTLLVAAGLVALSMWMVSHMFSALGGLLALLINLVAVVVVLAGTSGVGAMLMDRAQELPVRSFHEAALFGLRCIPKFLGLGLLVLLAGLAFFLVAAIVYFVCKIPVLGALLAFVAHPVLIVVGAALLVTLLFVINPLFAPAVWSGLSMKAALASVLGIARKRLVQVVLMQLVLYVVVGIISSLLMTGLLPVGMSLTGLAASIMGGGAGMTGGYGGYGYSPMGMFGGLMANGSMVGLVMGLAVLMAVVVALMAQVMILGLNLVYLQAQEHLNPEEAEGELNDFLGGMRQHAQQATQRAKQAAEHARQMAEQKAQEMAAAHEARRAAAAEAKAEQERQAQADRDRAAAEAVAAQQTQNQARHDAEQAAQQESGHDRATTPAPHCPACQHAVGPTDAFCGECGHKLK
jgi:hypothetical protein